MRVIYDPGFRVRGPPPPRMGWVHPGEGKEAVGSFVSKPHNTHYMYTYIHTDYTYTHTYLQTNTYIHQYMHVHTDTPHPPTGGRAYYTYTHTYLHTNTYIHPYMHVHTDTPPQPTGGGGGKTTCPPYIQKPVHPDPLGGGWGVGPAALDHICTRVYMVPCRVSPPPLPPPNGMVLKPRF